MHNNVPSYLSEMKPTENVERHNRNLRSNNNLNLPKCRINKYKNSLVPKAISLWNGLSLENRNIVNYTSFKTILEKTIPPPNILFNIGTRKTSIMMAKLRMKCILNAHLFQLKLVDDPSCKSGYFFVDSTHFFFVCPLYNGPRAILHNLVSPCAPFTLHTLLYGCNDLDFDIKKRIYLGVIKYINDTNRFE